MPWWILLLAGAALAIVTVRWLWRAIRAWAYDWRHAKHITAEVQTAVRPGFYGSMIRDEERAFLVRADGIVRTGPDGAVSLTPWEPPHGAEAGSMWEPKYEVINGHTRECLCPEGNHHWTACPQEDDWPDDDEDPGPQPDMLPAGPPADLVAAALASAEAAPEDAGWTDQLLADLHDAPTALDGLGHRDGPSTVQGPDGGVRNTILGPVDGQPESPSLERLADTGEIRLASARADYAAELRAQDDDAAEFISRLATAAAEFRLTAHGLA